LLPLSSVFDPFQFMHEPAPRLLVIGDIHGCFRALLNLVQFANITENDTLITLGDYVDRGPDSKSVVEWVMQRSRAGNCIPLRGNHEIMMLAALQGEMPLPQWLQYGGEQALKSYSIDGMAGSPDDVSQEHVQFLTHELIDYHETKTHLFSHAGFLANVPSHQQSNHDLFWERFDLVAPHMSGKTIICGHTAQTTGTPANKGYAICVDTWIYGRGWLTCLDVHSGDYWQADQQGHRRMDRLGPPS